MNVSMSRARLAAVLLAAVTLLLHGAALQAGWRGDDPAHLRFIASYAPWQYFSVREVMLEQSYAHITPWNAFFYDLGLPLFGLNAWGHHAHLLVVVWAAAWATWALLREHAGETAAWAGALLFLVMPSTNAVAQLLMTAHYAYGLLFTVLALWCWSRAVGRDSIRWACIAAALYALACLCKELYVPLPAVLLVWPSGRWQRRIRLFVPIAVVAAAYLAFRYWLFGGVGGYAGLFEQQAKGSWAESMARLGAAMSGVQRTFFGSGALAWSSLALVGALMVAGWVRRWRPSPWLVAAALLALLVPIVPVLTVIGQGSTSARFLFLGGWAFAVLLGTALRGAGKVPLALAALLILALGWVQHRVSEEIAWITRAEQPENQFILDHSVADALQPRDYTGNGYLRSMGDAKRLLTGIEPPRLVLDEAELVALGPQEGRKVWAWADACGCVQPLGASWDARAAHLSKALESGRALNVPMTVVIGLKGEGRIRRFEWDVQGPPGRLFIELPQFGRKEMPYAGHFTFGIDATVRLADSVFVRAVIETAEGAVLRSPLLKIPTARDSTVKWQTKDGGDEN